MKVDPTLVAASLLALTLVAIPDRRRAPEIVIGFGIDLSLRDRRALIVEATYRRVANGELRLSLPHDRRVVFEEIAASGARGAPLTWVLDEGERALVVEAGAERAVRVTCTVRFERGPVTTGEVLHAWPGWIDGEGCVLAPSAVLPVPEGPVRVSCDCTLPPGWNALRAPSAAPMSLVELAGEALVACSGATARRACAGGRVLLRAPAASAEVLDAAAALVEAMEAELGHPRTELDVLLVPRGDDRVPIDLPGTLALPALDPLAADGGSARRMARRLFAYWVGVVPEDLATDARADGFFGIALEELVALRVPARAGLDVRDSAALELAWTTQPCHAVLHAPREGLVTPLFRRERRMFGAALLHGFFERFPAFSLREVVAAWSGSGLPEPTTRATEELRAFVAEQRGFYPPPLVFERRHELLLEPGPRRATGSPLEELRLVVTTDALGALEVCGCEGRPAGGELQRATAIDRLRSASLTDERTNAGTLLYFSLGNGAPPTFGAPRELDHFWRRDAQRAAERWLRPHAIALGPEDVFAGLGELGEEPAVSFFGLTVGGEQPFARVVPLRVEGLARGAVAFLGLSELIDIGSAHDHEQWRLEGVRFPTGGAPLSAALSSARRTADLVVVGGHMGFEAVRAIAATGDVDLILVAGLPRGRVRGGAHDGVGFLGHTCIAVAGAYGQGFDQYRLELDERGIAAVTESRIVAIDPRAPVDPELLAAVNEVRGAYGLADLEAPSGMDRDLEPQQADLVGEALEPRGR